MTTTVAQRTPPSKAYYCYLDDTHGVLAKIDGDILFLADDGTLTVIEPIHGAFLMPLGECGLAETARILDHWHGGPARIACTRQQEVA
jgi:hypothetical protein